jgi:hypothetical protein
MKRLIAVACGLLSVAVIVACWENTRVTDTAFLALGLSALFLAIDKKA